MKTEREFNPPENIEWGSKAWKSRMLATEFTYGFSMWVCQSKTGRRFNVQLSDPIALSAIELNLWPVKPYNRRLSEACHLAK